MKENNITHLIAGGHPWFAERAIRTAKDMIYKRVENSKDENPQWTDFIFEVLLTYNNKLKHSATKYTPNQARDEKHELNAKLNLTLHKHHTRKYPIIQVLDRVNIFRKKGITEKERSSVWSENSYEVEKMIQELTLI